MDAIKLYDHQREIIEKVRNEFRYADRVLLQAATGFGKSLCAATIIKGALAKNKRIWFVVPRKSLLKQMHELFKSFKIKHTFIAANFNYYDNYPLALCTIETLRRNINKVTKPDFIFIDETHFYGNGVDEVIQFAIDNRLKVLGLSATPARQDNIGMGDWYETMVQGPSIRWLIDNKYLSEYRLIRPEVFSKKAITGNYVDLWRKHALGKRTVVFCRDIAHSLKVEKELGAAGIKSEHLDGTYSDAEREKIIRNFASGKTQILTNNMLLTFGFDLALASGLPDVSVEAMIDLSQTESLPLQMQKWGRVLRRKPEPAIIIDCAGNSMPEMHGLPCVEREWELTTGDIHKRDLEIRARNIRTMHCNTCYRPSKLGPPNCPWCGTPFVYDHKKIKRVNGVLVEITPEMLKQMQDEEARHKKFSRMEVGRAVTLEDLHKIAKDRGYKSGWVYAMARVKGINR